MSIRLQADVELTGVQHRWFPADTKSAAFGTINIGLGTGYSNSLYFHNTADIDAMVAELVALRNEMDPPVTAAPERPVHRLACGCTDPRCDCAGCQAGTPHEPGTPWHCGEHGKTAIVITDSERTCDQANPDTGAWCHRDGDHGVHEDTDGEEWRTDLAYTGHLRTPAIPAGPDDPHRLALAGPPYASEGIDGLRWDNMSSSGGAS